MKKLVTMMLLAVLAVWSSYGQTTAASYNFTQTTGIYTPITGGTSLFTTLPFFNGVSSAVPMPFAFTYLNQPVVEVYVATNGWIKLATTVGAVQSNTNLPISFPGTQNMLSALGHSLRGSVAGSEISYLVSGAAPNRVFVVQWKNVGFNFSGQFGDLNFQIRLYETSNAIEFVYGTFVLDPNPALTARPVQVGIKGTSDTDFNNCTGTTSWTNTTLGTSNVATVVVGPLSAAIVPPSGLTFRYAPPIVPLPAATFVPANAATSVTCPPDIPNTPVLSWTADATGGIPTSYDVYISTSTTMPATPAAANVTTTSLNASSLVSWAFNTTYYWRVVPKNALGTAVVANCPINSFTTFPGLAAVTVIAGRVSNFVGVPLQGVQIQAVSGSTTITTTTSDSGIYVFSNIAASTYTLTATHAAYNANSASVSAIIGDTVVKNFTMVQPTMGILPNPLNITLRPGITVSEKLVLTNAGPGTLTWSSTFAHVGSGSWLSMPTQSGTVAGITNVDIPLQINTAGLAAGTYIANVTFTSTNPVLTSVPVPINLTIAGAPVQGITTFTASLTDALQGVVTLLWTSTPDAGFLNYILKRNGTTIYSGTNKTFVDDLVSYGVYNYEVYAVYTGITSSSAFATIEWSDPEITYTPAIVADTIWTGTSKIVNHTLGNTGLGSLTYEFITPSSSNPLPMPTGYCLASSQRTTRGQILGIAFNTIVADSGAVWQNTNPASYHPSKVQSTYTDNSAKRTSVSPGSTYPIEVKLSHAGNALTISLAQVHAWIDFNRNAAFEDAERIILARSAADNLLFRGSVVVPTSALSGLTKMRIRHLDQALYPVISPCGTPLGIPNLQDTYGEVEDFTVDISPILFATEITPLTGIVPANTTNNLTVKFSATGVFAIPGTYTNTYSLHSNDLNTPVVSRMFQMTVIDPATLLGKIVNCATGAPLSGVMVTIGNYSTMTDESGTYSLKNNPGTYTVKFNKVGFQPVAVNAVVLPAGAAITLNDSLCEIPYIPACANATRDTADTKVDVSWCAPKGLYELYYDDATAESFDSWAYAGNMYAVKFTPASYPATVVGGKFYVGNNTYPVGGNIFGATFKVGVYAEGANGVPGALIGAETTATITTATLVDGWISVTGLNTQIASGNFFIVMTPLQNSPNCAPIGIDVKQLPFYKSYSRDITSNSAWELSAYQDLMIRAIVDGAVLAKSTETAAPKSASNYRVSRIAVANPDGPIQAGVSTLLKANHSGSSYTDSANVWTPLPAGWYAYSIEANYPNGEVSQKIYTNLVSHKLEADVTVKVSLTTGASPEGALVSLEGLDYPYQSASISLLVPASGTVVFPNMIVGDYVLRVSKLGFMSVTQSFVLAGDKTIPVILQELRYKPTNLYVDNKTLIATWDAPLVNALNENFEGATFPPVGWTTASAGNTPWKGGILSTAYTPEHTRVAYSTDGTIQFNNGCCDYLTTPTLNLTLSESYKLIFQSSYSAVFGLKASVEISVDGGITFEILQNITPVPYVWSDLSFDLTPYSGVDGYNNVKLRFHANDNGYHTSSWAIDNVMIQAKANSVQYYGLFLAESGQSESYVGRTANANELTFQYNRNDVDYGKTYTASVAARYSSGYSDHDYYTFTNLYLFPARNLAASTNGECSAFLEWNAPNPSSPITKGDILFDNGPIINSPGTGHNGADESLFNHDGLNLIGYGIQKYYNYSVADDFTIPASDIDGWKISKLTFYPMMSKRKKPSEYTHLYVRIWEGKPNAGGTVIWGDTTTNRLSSATFTNAYVGKISGDTTFPLMRITADGLNIALLPGNYWVEWMVDGFNPILIYQCPININGESTTGNALLRNGDKWINAIDNGFNTPQGMPFIVEGTSAIGVPENLVGYNIYRDDTRIATLDEKAKNYWDFNVVPGEHCYTIKAVYDLTTYGMTGTDESKIQGPQCLDLICGLDLPFTENWISGSFNANIWTTSSNNWIIDASRGNQAPAALFNYNPIVSNYNSNLESNWINAKELTTTLKQKIWLDFDYSLDDRTASKVEKLVVEVYDGTTWTRVNEFANNGDLTWTSKHIDISQIARGKVFKVRFVAKGVNSGSIVHWMVDNINIYEETSIPTPYQLTATSEGTPKNDIRVKWSEKVPCAPVNYILDDEEGDAAFAMEPQKLGWLGNLFTVTDYGVIKSVDLYFQPNTVPVGSATLTIEIFNDEKVLIGSSQPFIPQVNWQTVALPDVPFGGRFYAMVKWDKLPTSTPLFGLDTDGPEAKKGFGWYRDLALGWLPIQNVTNTTGVFTLRANVCKDVSKSGETVYQSVSIEPGTNASVVSKLQVSNQSMQTGSYAGNQEESSAKSFRHYQLYRATAPTESASFGSFAPIATTTTLEYFDQNVAAGCYKYYVTAVWTEGESRPSNEDQDCSAGDAVTAVSKSEITIYPNPATTVAHVRTDKNVRSISVYNAVGAMIYTQVVTNQGLIEIPTHNFAAGAYSVRIVTTNGETVSSKFIVTK